MTWTVEITDKFPACPGKLVRHGFASEREARIWAQREVEAAAELFIDGRANLTIAITREQ